MRTLKKALCLVLVLAMVLSLGVTAFAVNKSTEYTDYSTVTNKEAVDVLTAIGVLNGNTDGTFGPTGNFTRAQAATIIAHMMLGTKTAAALPQVATKFNDVSAAHWASGFINYCVDNGIINGYGDGRFGPEDTLTATQWALMLLNALGYVPAKEGIGGAGWEIKTTTLAVSTGVANAENLTGTFNRDVAAAMALNTLQSTLVEYVNNGLNITIGDTTINTEPAKATPIVSAVGFEGNINKDKYFTNANGQHLTVEFGEKYFTTLKLETGEDAFQRPSNDWSLDGKVIGSYAQKPVLEYTAPVTIATLYKDMGLSKADPNVKHYIDGATQANLNIERTDASAKAKIGGNGTLTQVFKRDIVTPAVGGGTATIETVYTVTEINTYVGDVTSKVGATSTRDAYVYVTARNGNSGTFNTTEFATDDVVLYTYSLKTGENKIQSVEKAETASGQLTRYTADTSMVVGDKTYNYSAKKANTANGSALKTDVTLVLDKYGYAIDVKATAAASKYALVVNFSNGVGYWNGTPAAQLVLTDGTVVEEAQLTGTKDEYGPAEFVAGDIVSYTINSKDKYTLTKVASVNSNSNATTAGSPAPVKVENGKYQMANIVGASNLVANGSTIFIVRTLDSDKESVFKVYNGIKNMPTIDTSKNATDKQNTNATVFCKTGTVATIVYVDAAATRLTTNDKNVIYVNYKDTNKAVTDSDGTYYVFQAIVNGEIVDEFKVTPETRALLAADRMFKDVSYSTSGNIASMDALDVANKAIGIEKVENDVLGFNTMPGEAYAAYVTSSDCKVFVRDENGTLTESSVASVPTTHTATVFYNVNANNQVNFVVIERTTEKAPISIGYAGISNGSKNIQLGFHIDDYWLTADDIKALGLSAGQFTVEVGGTEKSLVATASETDKGYNWNGTAMCIMEGSTWGAWNTAHAGAGFVKLHTGSNFATGEVVTIKAADNTEFTFTFDAANYTVA